MREEYTHVLRAQVDDDPFVDTKLFISDELTEPWEKFLNGQWMVGDPQEGGTHVVSLRTGQQRAVEAIQAKNNKQRFMWAADVKLRSQITRYWHPPIPSLDGL